MRVLPILAGLLLLGLAPAFGDDQDKQEIKRLQERLDLVEAKLAVLLATPVPAPPPVERTQNAAPAQVTRSTAPPELIPEIGKIGAETGLILSGSSNPFHLDNGSALAGFIDLPMFAPAIVHGKISYEMRVGLSRSKTKFQTTSNVAQVANLAALTALQPASAAQNLIDSVNGAGAAPFPVKSLTETSAKLLEIIPFSFKYTTTALDHLRLRPYAVLGFGIYATLHRETALSSGVRQNSTLSPEVTASLNQAFGGAPFSGSLVAGQLSQSAELTQRGLPIGAGNVDFGLHTGGGIEFRVNRGFSIGFDGRYNRLSGGQILGTYGTRLGFHF